MESKNRIACIVVTYNRKYKLRKNIKKLLDQTYDKFNILIIDNKSTDNTFEYIGDLIDSKKIFYYNTGKNLGGAGGFQFGVKLGIKFGYDYLWMMDDDSMPNNDALEKIVEFTYKANNFGFICSKVLWKDHSICKMNIPKKTLNKALDSSDLSKTYFPIIMGTFVSFFVPTKVIKNIGLPIKEFFIWSDDFEFSRRISRKYKCYYLGSSVIVHDCPSNNGANIVTDDVNRIGRYYYAYRNETYLYRHEGFKGILHLLVRFPYHVIKVILFSKDHKKMRLKQICIGTLHGFSFNPRIEYL